MALVDARGRRYGGLDTRGGVPLRAAPEALSDTDRAVLLLRDGEGMSTKWLQAGMRTLCRS